jgi:hypothetical protein
MYVDGQSKQYGERHMAKKNANTMDALASKVVRQGKDIAIIADAVVALTKAIQAKTENADAGVRRNAKESATMKKKSNAHGFAKKLDINANVRTQKQLKESNYISGIRVVENAVVLKGEKINRTLVSGTCDANGEKRHYALKFGGEAYGRVKCVKGVWTWFN